MQKNRERVLSCNNNIKGGVVMKVISFRGKKYLINFSRIAYLIVMTILIITFTIGYFTISTQEFEMQKEIEKVD